MAFPVKRLGCATITLGGLLPEKLKAIREAGFGATEILSRDMFESLGGAEVAINALAESGLVPSCFQLLRDQEGAPAEQRELKRRIAANVIDQMTLIGAKTLIVCSNVDPNSSNDFGRMRDDLWALGEMVQARGGRIAYEALCWGHWIRDYREAWKLIQAVDHPAVGLMLDSAHIGGLGLSFEAVDDIDPAKIFLVEIGDLPGTRLPQIDVSRYFRLMPGEGTLDLADFVRRLEKIGYDGIYSLEVFNTQYRTVPPAQLARHAFERLSDLLAPFGPST